MSTKKEIKRSVFTKLRNEENYTIKSLADHYEVTEQKIKRIMKQWGLSTTLKGRNRELGIELIDDLNPNLSNTTNYQEVNN